MEKKIKITIGNLEELMENEEWETENFLFEEDEEHQVWLDKNYLILRGLGLEIHSGVWYEKYEDDKDGNFEPDFDFYMFFDAETKVYLYMEQGSSLMTCIHNFTGLSWEEIEGQACEVVLTDQNIVVEDQFLIFE